MEYKIKTAFDAVRASEELKCRTKAFIARKTRGYRARKALNYRIIIPAMCLALVLFAGAGLYFTPTARISIDINPSLELGINRFDRVVSVNALNDDGRALAKTPGIKFADYDEALRRILDNESVEAMLSENEIMTITVIETSSAQSERILSDTRSCADGHNNVYCDSASSEEASAARELGLSFGKYRAFLELRELDADIAPEDIQEMSMREIRGRIAALTAENGNGEDPAQIGGGHHGNGYGHGHE